jgi:restriction system protein
MSPNISQRPSKYDERFKPVVSFVESLVPGRLEKKQQEAEYLFVLALNAWNKKIEAYNEEVEQHNVNLGRLKEAYKKDKEIYRAQLIDHEVECEKLRRDYEQRVRLAKAVYENDCKRQRAKFQRELADWEEERRGYYEQQARDNEVVDERRQAYLSCDPDAVQEYCEMILSNSDYPEYFPKKYELDYLPDAKTLLLDYYLPKLDDLPTIKEWKYVQSKDLVTSTPLPEPFRNKLFDDLVCRVALRSLYELFTADVAEAISSIVFNGRVESTDKATGLPNDACILSVQASKQEFVTINLPLVEPKACIRKLKGVASSKLHQLAPVAPIVQLARADKRFVEARPITQTLDDSTNLAAMDWEDFEHFIREVFEKVFSENGGEVKVTQASRDGGVDAVAFDPDPIRGGKIVIQAKRYTNPVGVSAVRDLYGTVMNEGAIKGILVTTSNYGPDAYEFAKGKPLTLLDGGNLLHLLEKHGRRARIDIAEARKIAAFREDLG